ncbi:hypothetical protein [Bartonella grahamii]|uniref:hypothetical protein n=1 Tax=Bartonella grahamii TaxID=33045 RepID=UPI0023616202|nr:hypothetical protein [Bartonella grahamii]
MKLDCLSVSKITSTEIRNPLTIICIQKLELLIKLFFVSISDLKHVAALSLDVDLQATAKAHGLLGKQHRKVTN